MPQLLTRPAFWLAAYLVLMNLVTFWVYGADKRRARRGRWRVPERTLFLLPLLGGSIGALAGMRCWGCGAFITRPGTGTSAGAFPPFSFSNWLPAAPYGT